MKNKIEKIFRSILYFVLAVIKSNKMLKRVVYDVSNEEQLGDLYFHETMVFDKVRMDTYHEGIRRNVKQGDVVVDLGTGTGILALFAAQQNPKKIYAIEHSELIETARHIASSNNVHCIEFVHSNSRDFKPSSNESVDVIIHEQIGNVLFEENMVQNLLDLKRRILKKTGKILPGKFEFYVEPVCLLDDRHVPFIWERRVHNVDLSCMKESNYENIDPSLFRGYLNVDIPPNTFSHFLCDPEPLLTFDLNEIESEEEISTSFSVSRKFTHSGHLDGLMIYFTVIFDDKVRFDTSPVSQRTHWGTRMFRLERREVQVGDTHSCVINLNDLADFKTWQFSIGSK